MKKSLKKFVAFISAVAIVVTSLVYYPATNVEAATIVDSGLQYDLTVNSGGTLVGFVVQGAEVDHYNLAWDASYATTVNATISGGNLAESVSIKTDMGSGGSISLSEINSAINSTEGNYTITFVGTGGGNNPNNDTTVTATLVVSEYEAPSIVDGTELIPNNKQNSGTLNVPAKTSGQPHDNEYKVENLTIVEDAWYVAKYTVTSNVDKKFELRLQDAADNWADYTDPSGFIVTSVSAGGTQTVTKIFRATRTTNSGIFDICMGWVDSTNCEAAEVQVTNISLKVYNTQAAAETTTAPTESVSTTEIVSSETVSTTQAATEASSEAVTEAPIEYDWQYDDNLTAYFGEGTRYAVVTNYPGEGHLGTTFPGGSVTFNADNMNCTTGAHGTSQTLSFNDKVINSSETSYAVGNSVSYEQFNSGINTLHFVGHFTAGDTLDVDASVIIEVPNKVLHFMVNDYSKYTGKYLTKFDPANNVTGYKLVVDGTDTAITVGGSGDYFTVAELKAAGITTGSHTVAIKGIVDAEHDTVVSNTATINVPENAGTAGDIAQIYIQTDDTTLSPTPQNGKTVIDKVVVGKQAASITAVDKDGGTIPAYFEDLAKTTVKVRGNSTAGAVKKAYNITFNKGFDLFGIDGSSKPAKKWSLLANAFDKALIRNYLGMQLGTQMGVPFTPSCKYIDLYFNGVFMGNYLVIESIEKGKSRVDIDSENTETYKSDALLELEEIHAIEDEANFTTSTYSQTFIFGSPETVDDMDGNTAYFNQKVTDVAALFNKFETDLANKDWTKIQQDIDVTSFAKFYVCSEIMTTKDFNQSSTRFHVVNGKIYGGPLWDMDYSSDNNYDNPAYTQEYQLRMPWFRELMKIPEFKAIAINEYKHIRAYVRKLYSDGGFIDQLVSEISGSAARNYASAENNGAGWSISTRDNGDGYGYLSIGGATPYTSFNDANDTTSAVYQVKNYFEKRVEGLDRTWNVEACVEMSHENGDIIVSWDEVDGATGYKVKFSAKAIQPVSPAPLFVQQIADDYTDQTVTVNGETLSYNFTDNNYELEDGSYVYVEYTLDGSTYDSLDYVIYHEMEEYEYITDWVQLAGTSAANGAKIYAPASAVALMGNLQTKGYLGAGAAGYNRSAGMQTVPVFTFGTTGNNASNIVIDGVTYTANDTEATDVYVGADCIYINQNLVDAQFGETNYYHITATGSGTGSFWIKVVGEQPPNYSGKHVNDDGWTRVTGGDSSGTMQFYYETAELTGANGKYNGNIFELRDLGSNVSYHGASELNTLKTVPIYAFSHTVNTDHGNVAPTSIWLNDTKLTSSQCSIIGDSVLLAQSIFDLDGEQSEVFYVTLRYADSDYTFAVKVVDSTKEAPPALDDAGWTRFGPNSDYWFYIPDGSAITRTAGTTDRGGDLWMVLTGSIAHPYTGATFAGEALTVPGEGAGFAIPYSKFTYSNTVYKVVATDSNSQSLPFYVKKTTQPVYTPQGLSGTVSGSTLSVRWTPTADAIAAGATYTVTLAETTIANSITANSTTYDMSELVQGQYSLTLTTTVNGVQVDSQTINVNYTDFEINEFTATGSTKLAWEKYRADKLSWNITSANPIVGYAYYVDGKLFTTEETTETTHTYLLPAYAIAQIYSQDDPTNGLDAFGQPKSSGQHTVKVVAFTSNLNNAPATYSDALAGKTVGSDTFTQDVTYVFGDKDMWNKTSSNSPWNFTITDGSKMKITYHSDGSVKVSDMEVNKSADEPQWQLKAAIYDRHLPVVEAGNKVNVSFDVRLGGEEFIGHRLYIKICSDEVDDNYSYYGQNTPANEDVTYEEKYYTFESDGEGGAVIHYSVTIDPHVLAPHGDQYDLLFGIGELEGYDLELTVPEVQDVYKVTKAIASANLTDAAENPGTITINWNTDVPERLKSDYYYKTFIDDVLVSSNAQLSETQSGFAAGSTHTVRVESWYKETGTKTGSAETTVTIPEEMLPNLVAASVVIDDSSSRYKGDTIPVKVIIANVGDADCSTDFTVKLEAQPYGKTKVDVGTVQTVKASVTPLLKPADPNNPIADAIVLTFNYPIDEVGNTTFTATVDYGETVTESTENDNSTMYRYAFYDRPESKEYCDIVGFQLNALTNEEADPSFFGPSFRTLARISYDDKEKHTIGGKTVTEYGMVFALTDKAESVGKDNMTIDSEDNYVAYLAANSDINYTSWTTRGGKFSQNNSSFFGLTIRNLFYDESELTKSYSFRAYYKLGDEVVYSDNIYTVNMEEIASDLYVNQKMYSKKSHEFLYYTILNPMAAKRNYLRISQAILTKFNAQYVARGEKMTNTSPEYIYTNLLYKDLQGYALCKQGYCYGTEKIDDVPDKDLRFTHVGPLNANNDGIDSSGDEKDYDMDPFQCRRLTTYKVDGTPTDVTSDYLGLLNGLQEKNYSSVYDWIYNELPENGFARRHSYSWEGHQYNSDDVIEDLD